MREEAVEAASRAECFAQCKARGVVPVSVKDGARKGGRQDVGSPSGRNESQPFPKRKLFTLRFCLLVAIAALAAIAWWRLAAREDVRPSDPAPMKTKPTEKPKAKPATVPATNSAPRLVRHRRPKTVPVATADVAPPDLPMFAEAPRRYGEINGSNIWPRALFKTREENMVAGLITAKPGSRIVLNGFLPGEEERLLASLDIPVEFEDIDTPQERAVKEYMIQVKAELKEAVAKGEKITDIVQSMRNELNGLANYRDKLRQAHLTLMKEGTPKEAEEFRQEANKMLEEYGMDPIAIRSTQRARLGLDR